MLLATGEARFADADRAHALQRLHRRAWRWTAPATSTSTRCRCATAAATRPSAARAQPWFACACCPPNVMRLLASASQHYLATRRRRRRAGPPVRDRPRARGRGRLRVATDYPWDGRVELEVADAGEAPWTLSLRVPAWAAGATLASTTSRSPARARLRAHRADVAAGDRVVLELADGAAPDRAAPAHRRRPRLPGDRARPARLLPRGRRRTCGSASRRPADRPGRRRCAPSRAPTCWAGSSRSARAARTARRLRCRLDRRRRRARGRRRGRWSCWPSPTRSGPTAAAARCASGSRPSAEGNFAAGAASNRDMTSPRRTSLLAGAAAVLVIALLAGCGGGSSSPSAPKTTSGHAATLGVASTRPRQDPRQLAGAHRVPVQGRLGHA